jgi:outer membrane protein OmpA-like peptidoglycan-associated protein
MNNLYYRISLIALFIIAIHANQNYAFAQEVNSGKPFIGHFYLQPNAGISQYFGDLNEDDFWNKYHEPGLGIVMGCQVSPVFSMRTQFLKSTLYSERNDQNLKLYSDFWDASFNLTLNVNELFAKYNEKRFINFYLFSGIGVTSFISKIEDQTTGEVINEHPSAQTELFAPVGVGASIRLNPTLAINLEYGDHITFNDNTLDFSDNLRKRDHYSYASVGLNIKLCARDRDNDGVKDKKDLCRDIPGKIELSGCPDKDNDGIVDLEDTCPEIAGTMEFRGCPDTDGDRIPDQEDACPTVAGKKETKGCPDTDGDGVIDSDDLWPAVFGLAKYAGVPDSDGDGIPDNNDSCKDVKGLSQFMGCPDTDTDGIPDNKDKCPNEAGVAENNGCPAVIMGAVMQKTVYFDTDSWVTMAKYIIEMNEIAAYMNEHPEAVISISGHADARESEEYNLRLSEKRADYVISYLKEKGMKSTNIEKSFFGKSKPAADNSTAKGRALNRRVEIRISW